MKVDGLTLSAKIHLLQVPTIAARDQTRRVLTWKQENSRCSELLALNKICIEYYGGSKKVFLYCAISLPVQYLQLAVVVRNYFRYRFAVMDVQNEFSSRPLPIQAHIQSDGAEPQDNHPATLERRK